MLSSPILRQRETSDILSILALLSAGLSWAAGSVLISRERLGLAARVSSGYQHLFGVLGLGLAALVAREPVPQPTAEALGAWGYLILFGSILGFTAFVNALRLLPTSVAMTYAYVNPVIAVVLGWLILSEPITVWTLAGAALVLLGVAGVFRDRRSSVSAEIQASR